MLEEQEQFRIQAAEQLRLHQAGEQALAQVPSTLAALREAFIPTPAVEEGATAETAETLTGTEDISAVVEEIASEFLSAIVSEDIASSSTNSTLNDTDDLADGHQ